MIGVGTLVTNQHHVKDSVRLDVIGANERNDHDDDAKKTPLLHQIAPVFFRMNVKTGLMDLPEEVKTLLIDVGARESDYLRMMESDVTDTRTTALIMVDPLPDSIIPLQARAAAYAMRGRQGRNPWLNETFTQRISVMNAAMADREHKTIFNIGSGPACSSLLPEAANNTFWCAKAKQSIAVLVFTLKDLLDLVPISQITDGLHLKVDAEGADLLVLKGAGKSIRQFDSVIIECNSKKLVYHEGECFYDEAKSYMASQGFDGTDVKGQGDLINAFFWKEQGPTIVPSLLYQNTGVLTFRSFYKQLANRVAAQSGQSDAEA